MSKVSDMAKKVSKRMAEDPTIREMGSQVTQKLSVAGKQIQDQMPSQAEISKISKSISKTIGEEISKNSEKTRDFTAKKLKEISSNLENQKFQNSSKPENKRLSEMSKNQVNQSIGSKITPNQITSNPSTLTSQKIKPVHHNQSKTTFGTSKITLAGQVEAEKNNSGNVSPTQNEQESIFRSNPKSDFAENIIKSPSEGLGLLERIKNASEPTPSQKSVSSYLASGSRFIPQRFQNYLSVPTALTEKKKSYDTFKSRLVLSRNVWITGAIAGIIAAMVGTVYTYEAILIQRREKELLNIEIEIKKIELERLRDVYKEELLTKERARYVKHSEKMPPHEEHRKSWLSYITGN